MNLKIILILLICICSCKMKELEYTKYNVTRSDFKVSREHSKKMKKKFNPSNVVIFSDERKLSFSSFILVYDYKNRLEVLRLNEYDTNFYNQRNLDTLNRVIGAPDTIRNPIKYIYLNRNRIEYIANFAPRGQYTVKNGFIYQLSKKGVLKGIYRFKNDTLREIIMTSPKLLKNMKRKFYINY